MEYIFHHGIHTVLLYWNTCPLWGTTHSEIQGTDWNLEWVCEVGIRQSPHLWWPCSTIQEVAQKGRPLASQSECIATMSKITNSCLYILVYMLVYTSLMHTECTATVLYSGLAYLVMTVCRSGRMSRRIFLIWGSNPMSSILSASSSTCNTHSYYLKFSPLWVTSYPSSHICENYKLIVLTDGRTPTMQWLWTQQKSSPGT